MGSLIRSTGVLALAALLAVLAAPATSSAQFIEELGNAAKDAAKNETERQVKEMSRDAVRCAFDNLECIREAREEGREVVVTDEQGDPVSEAEAGRAVEAAESRGAADANYDFEPGAQTFFATNLSADPIGNFPGDLEFRGGNMEIVDWGGERWLRSTGDSSFVVELPAPLPENYTITFDAKVESGISDGIRVVPEIPERALHYYDRHYFVLGHRHRSGVKPGGRADGLPTSTNDDNQMGRGVATGRIMVDGPYAKVYVNEHRVANIPNADLARGDRILFVVPGSDDAPTYIRDIRIAGEDTSLWARLERDGQVTVEGIEFEESSATLKPASAEALADIAAMLEDHPELDLVIQSHTDVSGGFDANMDLSRARAEAVRSYLAEKHGVSADRLRAMGLGSSQPVAEGDDPDKRKKNSRVVLSAAGR